MHKFFSGTRRTNLLFAAVVVLLAAVIYLSLIHI